MIIILIIQYCKQLKKKILKKKKDCLEFVVHKSKGLKKKSEKNS